MWIFAAFLNPILHALSNILDNYLTNKLFDKKTTLIFYAALLNIFFLPFIFIFVGLPDLPTHTSVWLFLGLAAINILYLYPYYKALEQNDTSSVIALFSLGQIFVPILAYFMVREVLSPIQYAGVGVIILASLGLSLQKGTRFKLNASFWWMLLCTFILAFEYVLYKFTFVSVNWITGFTWPVVFSFLIVLLLLVPKSIRKDILDNFSVFQKKFHIFALEELTTFSGIAAGTFAVSVAPVTMVKAISSVEPAFVLMYASIFSRRFPEVFKEEIDAGSVRRKVSLFVVMGVGLLLVLQPDL